MKDDRGEEDLTFLAEQHAKEIWALKEQISKQSEELTVLRGTKDVVVRLGINDDHQRYNGKLQIRVTELEGDNKRLSQQISDYIKKHEDRIRKAGL